MEQEEITNINQYANMKCASLILAVLAGVNAAAVPKTEIKDRLIEFSPDSAPM